MARKVKPLTIADEGRDKGKTFILREMPAMQAEKWAIRLFLAMARSGMEVPEDISRAGLAGIAVLGVRALSGVKFEEAEPLLNEMMKCITIAPDPHHPEVERALIADDIEETKTLFTLRKELLTLHTGFSSLGDALSSQSS